SCVAVRDCDARLVRGCTCCGSAREREADVPVSATGNSLGENCLARILSRFGVACVTYADCGLACDRELGKWRNLWARVCVLCGDGVDEVREHLSFFDARRICLLDVERRRCRGRRFLRRTLLARRNQG